ncbi:MAG: hypothetical protein ACLFVU_11755 [Phycisphaerae bacterium]
MLAALSDWLRFWHVPVILIYAAAWILLGGYVLAKSMNAHEQRRRPRTGKGMLVAFLSLLAGLVGAGMFFLLVRSIGNATDTSVLIPSVIAAVGGLFLFSLLVVYGMYDLSLFRSLRASMLYIVAVLALTAVVGVGAGIPTYSGFQQDLGRQRCRGMMTELRNVLLAYQESQLPVTPVDSLETLQTRLELEEERLRCPRAEGPQAVYFYHPNLINMGEDVAPGDERRLIASDRTPANHGGAGRTVVLGNGDVRWYDEQQFQQLLQEPQNQDFAEALRQDTGGQ